MELLLEMSGNEFLMMSLRLLYGKNCKQTLNSFGDKLLIKSNLNENDCAQIINFCKIF